MAATLFLLLNSCAVNSFSNITKVKIHTPENSGIIYENDTIQSGRNLHIIHPPRSRDSLGFSVFNDSVRTDLSFRSKFSSLHYQMLTYTLGLHYLVNRNNPLYYDYKANIYIELDSLQSKFYPRKTKIAPFEKNTVMFYTSPLMAIDLFNTPMLTIGAEYFFIEDISISAEFGTRYFDWPRVNQGPELIDKQGNSFRLELKYYGAIDITDDLTFNEYFGIEYRYKHEQFTQAISYSTQQDDIKFVRNENFIVVKNLSILNLKYGANIPLGRRFFFDVYTGLGARFIDIQNPGLRFNPPEDELINDVAMPHIDETNIGELRRDVIFNFTLGFKFGIRL